VYYIYNHSRISYNTCYNSVVVIIDKKASAFFQRIRGGGRRLNIISLKCDFSFPYSFLDLLFITLFEEFDDYLYYVASKASVNRCIPSVRFCMPSVRSA